MNDFPIGETATAGFRVLTRRPLTIAFWFAATLVFSVAVAAVMLPAFKSYMAGLSALTGASPDPRQMIGTVGRFFGAVALVLPVYLLFAAVMTTAANRAVLDPDKSAFGYLRVGGDELRTLVVLVVVSLIVIVAYMAFAIVFGLVFGVAVAGGAATGNQLATGVATVLGGVLMVVGVIAALAYFATRMSLAVPQTFDTKSINIFGTWRLTKGATGKLFLAYLLAFCIYFAVSLAGGLINVILGMGSTAGALGALGKASAKPDVEALFSAMGPAFAISMLVSAVVSTIGLAVMVCPTAEAYRLLGRRTADAAEVFA